MWTITQHRDKTYVSVPDSTVKRCYTHPVRTTLFIFLLSLVLPTARAAERWTFHCEAEKGDLTASVPREPTPLDSHILELPRYSPDPLDRDAVIQRTTVRVVGSYRTHRIIEAHLEYKESYYTDLYILLCEAQPGRYLPIYVQQYARGIRTPELAAFSITDDHCSINVVVRYSGTAASKTTDVITLTEDDTTGLKLRSDRKA